MREHLLALVSSSTPILSPLPLFLHTVTFPSLLNVVSGRSTGPILHRKLVLQSQLEQTGGRMLQGGEADDHRRRGRTSKQSRRGGDEYHQSERASPGGTGGA